MVNRLGGFFQCRGMICLGKDIGELLDNSRIIAEGLPEAELCILHGGGHMVNLEQPTGFNEAILEFLAGL